MKTHENTSLRAEASVERQNVIGAPYPHESAALHVSGQAVFGDDIPLPGDTLHAALGLSQIASGRITELDLSAVESSEDVVSVVTLNDIPGHTDVGPVFPGDPLLTDDEIRYWAQPIFLVVARSEKAARRAVLAANIEYQTEPAILELHQAIEQQRRVRPPHQMLKGDPDAEIEHAAHQIQGELSIGGQEHFYLEGQVSAALPTESGGVLVHSSTQHPSEVQKLVAEVLNLPMHEVCVEVRRMGGAFGGKETQAAPWACLAAVAALKCQRPVKLRLPRALDMQVTGKRHPFFNRYRVGFDAEGVIAGVEFELNGDCGHSPDLSDAIVDRAMFHADNAYHYPSAKILGERWFTNKVSNTAFRGFGGPQGMLSCEAMMDDIARHLRLDPLDLRLRNLYPDAENGGGTTPYHQSVAGDDLKAIMTQLEQTADYRTRREQIRTHNRANPRRLKGLSLTPVKFGISFTVKHLNQAGVLMHIYTDGTLLVSQAGTEMGQGLHTKVAQVTAQAFGLPLDRVKLCSTRTDKVPNTSPTAASSGSDLNGMAALDAATQLRSRLVAHIAEREQIDASRVTFDRGQVRWPGGSETFAQTAQSAYMARVSLSTTGFYRTPKIHYDRATASGRPFFYYALGAACSEVQVDQLTGSSQITRVDILHDCGASLNPAIDQGQIEGGFIQGAGWLTSEELVWNAEGKLLTDSPATYKIPAIGDTPAIFNVAFYDRPNDQETIHRSKAVGEPPLMLAISVWCAIRDAVSSVSDYTLSPQLSAPATPEQIFFAIRKTRERYLD